MCPDCGLSRSTCGEKIEHAQSASPPIAPLPQGPNEAVAGLRRRKPACSSRGGRRFGRRKTHMVLLRGTLLGRRTCAFRPPGPRGTFRPAEDLGDGEFAHGRIATLDKAIGHSSFLRVRGGRSCRWALDHLTIRASLRFGGGTMLLLAEAAIVAGAPSSTRLFLTSASRRGDVLPRRPR